MDAKGAKILVVEDDPNVQSVVRRIVEKAGHQVDAASSGDEAASRVGENYDIVLTDLMMPGKISGTDVTRIFRDKSAADVIIMTAYPNLDTAILGMREGAYDYLVKPVIPDNLLWVIQRCLQKRSLSTQLQREKELRHDLHQAYEDLRRLSQVRELFGQFATPEVAREIIAHPNNSWTTGRRTRVSVLFADIRNFTTYAAEVSPEEATSALNEIFWAMDSAIRSYGGIINKFLGDGAMMLFGAPLQVPDHERAAVAAALAIQREMEALALGRSGRGLKPLQLGIGINTGEVISGCLGSERRREYTVIGAPVNLAARLEKSARGGEILVGPDTALAIQNQFELSDQGLMAFHGIREAVRVHLIKTPKIETAAR